MNVLSNYAANNRYQPQTMYRFTSAGFNNVVAFKAAPHTFEEMFSTRFLYSLANEGATCAYTGKKLFPQVDISHLQGLKDLLVPLSYDLGFEYLEKCDERIFEGKNKIYNALKREHEKHQEYNLQEIVNKLYPIMVKRLCKKEGKILNDITLCALGNNLQYRNSNLQDFATIRDFIIKNMYYDINIFNNLSTLKPIVQVKELNISNQKTLDEICRKLGKLCILYRSTEGFIINSKLKGYNPWKIALNLLRDTSASLNCINPQNQKTLENKDNSFNVSILSCLAISKFKYFLEFNDFLKYSPFPVRKNLQKHIDSLIEIQKRWTSKNESKKAKKLANYILVLKYELEKRGNRLKINVDELRDTIGQEDFDKRTEKVKDWLEIK